MVTTLCHFLLWQSNQYLNTTYESLYHSHGYLLQSQTFYISLHCFVAKFLIQVFKNVHGLK